jgi:hypothetical protein
MGRTILAFLLIFGVFFVGISLFWHTQGATKVKLLKVATYSAMCAIFTLFVLVGIVFLF